MPNQSQNDSAVRTANDDFILEQFYAYPQKKQKDAAHQILVWERIQQENESSEPAAINLWHWVFKPPIIQQPGHWLLLLDVLSQAPPLTDVPRTDSAIHHIMARMSIHDWLGYAYAAQDAHPTILQSKFAPQLRQARLMAAYATDIEEPTTEDQWLRLLNAFLLSQRYHTLYGVSLEQLNPNLSRFCAAVGRRKERYHLDHLQTKTAAMRAAMNAVKASGVSLVLAHHHGMIDGSRPPLITLYQTWREVASYQPRVEVALAQCLWANRYHPKYGNSAFAALLLRKLANVNDSVTEELELFERSSDRRRHYGWPTKEEQIRGDTNVDLTVPGLILPNDADPTTDILIQCGNSSAILLHPTPPLSEPNVLVLDPRDPHRCQHLENVGKRVETNCHLSMWAEDRDIHLVTLHVGTNHPLNYSKYSTKAPEEVFQEAVALLWTAIQQGIAMCDDGITGNPELLEALEHIAENPKLCVILNPLFETLFKHEEAQINVRQREAHTFQTQIATLTEFASKLGVEFELSPASLARML